MVVKPIQIFKTIICIANKLLQFQEGVHHHVIGRVAMERFAGHGDILDCRL